MVAMDIYLIQTNLHILWKISLLEMVLAHLLACVLYNSDIMFLMVPKQELFPSEVNNREPIAAIEGTIVSENE